MFRKTMSKHGAGIMLALVLASPAFAATPLINKTVTLQCLESRVDLRADCFPYAGRMLACTRQTLSFTGADGKEAGSRVFKPGPLEEGDDYAVIEEKVGALMCVQTKDKQQLVVASMFNGGNCAQCEWIDVYALDGKLLGSTRDRKGRNAALSAGIEAVNDKQTKRIIEQTALRNFYQTPAAR
jgi:hypothetical protein